MNDRERQFRVIYGDGEKARIEQVIPYLLKPIVPDGLELVIQAFFYGEELLQFAEQCEPDLFIFFFNGINFLSATPKFPNSTIDLSTKEIRAQPQPYWRLASVLALISHVKESYTAPIFVISGHDGNPPLTKYIEEVSDVFVPTALMVLQHSDERLESYLARKRTLEMKLSELAKLVRENLGAQKKKPRILIVDDDPIILKLLSKVLTSQGYDTVMAVNGEDALNILQRETFDLMMSDINMRPVDGIELLKKVRKAYANMTVIMHTPFCTSGSAIEAMSLGAFDYMPMPFKLDEMLFTVQCALEHREVYRGKLLMALLQEGTEDDLKYFKKAEIAEIAVELTKRATEEHNSRGMNFGRGD